MSSGIQITIAGQDYGTLFVDDITQLKVESDVAASADNCSLPIRIFYQAVRPPEPQMEIIITDLSTGIREFAGVVQTSEEDQLLDPWILRYAVRAQDYTPWLNHHLVVESYPEQDGDATLKAIVAQFVNVNGSPVVFTTNNVQSSYTTQARVVDHQPVSQSFQDLCNETQFGWYCDYYKDIHYFARESFISPLPGNFLDIDNDLTSYHDLKIRKDGSQLRNRIFEMGFYTDSSVPRTQSWVADGQITSWSLAFPPASKLSADTITVGGAPYTPTWDTTQTGAAGNTNAYISTSQSTLRLDVAPAAGTVVSITYLYQYQLLTEVDDSAAQAATKAIEGTDGIYEYAYSDPSLTGQGVGMAQAKAKLALNKYATPQSIFQFGSYLSGWRAGQYFTATSNKRWGSKYQNQTLYVQKCTKSPIVVPTTGKVIWNNTITASDRPWVF
jgi:hypothetical protein